MDFLQVINRLVVKRTFSGTLEIDEYKDDRIKKIE